MQMALSYYNWEPLYYFDPPPELLDCCTAFFPSDDTSCLDPIFNPDDFAPPSNVYLNYSLAPESELDPYLCPKRQKSFEEEQYTYNNGNLFNPLPEFSPELIFPVLEFEALPPPVVESTVKKPALSAQSIAARQRRRRITEKTRELGKLIPGGHKMSTAEMFEAASKYINYLQAQIAIFQIMDPVPQNEGPLNSEEILLQALVASPWIQVKLYSAEKCLIPKLFVETLANGDEALKQNPIILNEISQLIQTN